MSPEEIQQLIKETTTPVVTGKTVKAAVAKVDQARSKLQSAQAARKNLHDKWSNYLGQRISRWKGFAEDFSNKD